METKANYLLNAILVALVLVTMVGFVHWFHTGSVTGTRATYNLVFRGSVGGLLKGAEVDFNGMQVGEVADMQLDKNDPQQVVATISVDSNVPIRSDTDIAMRFGTVAGVAWIELRGGDPRAPAVPEGPDGIPTLIVDESVTQGLSASARNLSRQFDQLTGEDSALHKSLANFEAFTAALKHNSDRLDHVLAGFERLAGSGDKPGEFTSAVKSIRLLGDNLGKRIDELSPGLAQFTGPGLKNLDGLMSDVRRAVTTAEKVFKNISDNPSSVLFGNTAAPQPAPAVRQPQPEPMPPHAPQ
jgi:phospholipid/cholesterol/gamma-HCH transport system substrate-binding protein